MDKIAEQKFLEWFDELESYSFRSERFYDVLNSPFSKEDLCVSMRSWIEAAFEEGFKSGIKYALDDYADWSDTTPGEFGDHLKKDDVKYQISLLNKFPRVQANIESMWGTQRGRDFLNGLVIDDREGRYNSKVQGFPENIYKTIVHIFYLHDKLFPKFKPKDKLWDSEGALR